MLANVGAENIRKSSDANVANKTLKGFINPLTPVPPLTAHDEPWPFCRF